LLQFGVIQSLPVIISRLDKITPVENYMVEMSAILAYCENICPQATMNQTYRGLTPNGHVAL